MSGAVPALLRFGGSVKWFGRLVTNANYSSNAFYRRSTSAVHEDTLRYVRDVSLKALSCLRPSCRRCL